MTALSSYRSKATESPVHGIPWWHAGLLLAAALLLQVEIAHSITLRGGTLSLVLLAVVWYAMHVPSREALVFGLIAGLCEDALSAGTGAAWTLSTVLTALAVSRAGRIFFADSVPVLFCVVIAATLLRQLVFWIVMATQGYPSGYATLHTHQALWEALLNGMFVLLAALTVQFFNRRRSA